jgi:hypothetical protein
MSVSRIGLVWLRYPQKASIARTAERDTFSPLWEKAIEVTDRNRIVVLHRLLRGGSHAVLTAVVVYLPPAVLGGRWRASSSFLAIIENLYYHSIYKGYRTDQTEPNPSAAHCVEADLATGQCCMQRHQPDGLGRQRIPFVCGQRQRELLQCRQGESDLVLVSGAAPNRQNAI